MLVSAAAALGVFSVYVAIQARRMPGIACDCFGAFVATRYTLRHAITNLLLALFALGGAVISAGNIGAGDLMIRFAATGTGLAATATVLVTIPAIQALTAET